MSKTVYTLQMNYKINIPMSLVLLLLSSCATENNKIKTNHVSEAHFFLDDQKAVFYSNDNLSDSSISEILKSRVKLPIHLKIAIIKLQPKLEERYTNYRMSKNPTAIMQNESTPYLTKLLSESESTSNREFSTSVVPESLIPAKANIKWMRNLGITMQADLVLVIDSKNDLYRDQQIFKNGIAMSVSHADAYLVDTRTGIIINSNSYSKEAFTEKTDKDYDAYQTLDRARIDSEKKIYKKLVNDIKATIETIR